MNNCPENCIHCLIDRAEEDESKVAFLEEDDSSDITEDEVASLMMVESYR